MHIVVFITRLMLDVFYILFYLNCNKYYIKYFSHFINQRNVLVAQLNKLYPLWWSMSCPNHRPQIERKVGMTRGGTKKGACAMLGDLSERMHKMELSQTRQVNRHRKESAESSTFGSVLGLGAGIILQILEHPLLPSVHRMSRRPPT